MQDEYFDVNVNGTENILKLAKEYGFKVVYASSSSVYGNPKHIPIKESDDRNPLNPYAKTKLEDELLAKKYSEMGVHVIGLRYFNVFGRRQSKEYAGVIKLFLEKIQQNKDPKINGDGLQTRDFVYIEDVVKANILAMDSDIKHEFLNVGTGCSISILDLANVCIQASGLSLKPTHGPELPGDVRATEADTKLIEKLLNWKAKTKLEDWLFEIISTKNFKDV
jgi:UDP-glucose 4-epimerase